MRLNNIICLFHDFFFIHFSPRFTQSVFWSDWNDYLSTCEIKCQRRPFKPQGRVRLFWGPTSQVLAKSSLFCFSQPKNHQSNILYCPLTNIFQTSHHNHICGHFCTFGSSIIMTAEKGEEEKNGRHLLCDKSSCRCYLFSECWFQGW